jgi:transposase
MKTQLRKPARDRSSYSDQYKQEALELWRNSGRSAAKVAAELGIRPPLLYRWAHLERESNTSRSEPKSKRSVEALEAEIRRLRAENAKLLEQREVLKNHWASSPKCRPEVCPNRANERPTQSSLVV